MQKYLLFGLFAVILFFCGCTSTRGPELDVENQWGDTMRRLGMFPFYPATEDVRVGDVYLLVPLPAGILPAAGRVTDAFIPWSRPDHDGSRFSLLRLGSLGAETKDKDDRRLTVLGHLIEQQNARPSIEPLPSPQDSFAKLVGSRPAPRAVQDKSPSANKPVSRQIGNADQSIIVPRLQRASIPGLTVARVTVGQVNTGATINPLLRSLGLTRSTETAIDITLGDVQELALEPFRIEELYKEHARDLFRRSLRPDYLMTRLRSMRYGRNNIYDLTKPACRGDVSELMDQGVQIAVVSHVLYAGWIDYTFLQTTTTAGNATFDPTALAAPVKINATTNTPTNNGTNTGGNSGVKTEITTSNSSNPSDGSAGSDREDLAALVKALRETVAGTLGGLAHPQTNGSSTVTFGIGSLGRLSLRESFNRPMAVGAGGRKILTFHQALRGVADPIPSDDFTERFKEATAFCRQEFALRDLDDFAGARYGLCRAMSGGDTSNLCAEIAR